VLDDAVEEKDGGEKVRLGMVVSFLEYGFWKFWADVHLGHSWKLSRYARGSGENRRRKGTARWRIENENLRISPNTETFRDEKIPSRNKSHG
jgi:hypothetical protein